VRRRGPGHDPRLLGPDRAPGEAAHRVRCVPRRLQGVERAACGAQVRSQGKGLQVRGDREALRSRPVPGHSVLELQPLRGPRRFQEGQGLRQRPGGRPTRAHPGGSRRLVLRSRAHFRARAGVREGRRQAQHRSRPAPPPGGQRARPHLRDPVRPLPGRPGARGPHLLTRLHRRVPGRAAGVLRPAAAGGHGHHCHLANGADLAPGVLSAPPRDQARPHDLEHLLQPHPPPPRRLLRPALLGRDRLAGGNQQQGRLDGGRQALHHDVGLHPGHLLRRVDVPLRLHPHHRLHPARARQRHRGKAGVAQAR